MVYIYYGRAGCGKTHRLMSDIRGTENGACLIVPEQLSMTREFAVGGDKSVSVLSFARLADNIFRSFGGTARKQPDRAMTAAAVFRAVINVYDELVCYKRVALKSGFISKLISAFSDFDTNCMTYESILRIPENELARGARDRYHDLFLIYSEYKRLWGKEYRDGGDTLSAAAGVLELHDMFVGKTVAFDGFYGFTEQQLLLVEQIMIQASGCIFAFTTDLNDDIFTTVNREIKRIEKLSKKVGETCVAVNCDEGFTRFEQRSIIHLEKNIFSASPVSDKATDGAITVYAAKNINEELNFVACKIKNDVLSGKYRYRDIAVLAPDADSIGTVADAVFSKHGVPIYTDIKRTMLSKSLTAFVSHALEITLGGFTLDNVFPFLKTGLCGIGADDVSILENYVRMWKISDRGWRGGDWTQSPSGLNAGRDDSVRLEKLNALRKAVSRPLIGFSDSIRAAKSCRDMLGAVYALLGACSVSDNLEAVADSFKKSGKLELYDEYMRIYDIFIGMLDSIDRVFGVSPVTPRAFYDMLSVAAGAITVSHRPARVDEVVLAGIGRSRPENIKCVYIVRMNDGVIPSVPTDSSLISEADKNVFSRYGISTSMNFAESSVRERFDFYSAVFAASEEICFSYSQFKVTGDILLRSSYLDGIEEIIGKEELCHDGLPPEFHLVSLSSAAELASTGMYAGLSETVSRLYGYTPPSDTDDRQLSDAVVEALYSRSLRLSFSGVEEYVGCPFRFFIHRGLRAVKNEPVEFDPANIGTFIHSGLERLLSRGNIAEMDESAVKKAVAEISDDYYNNELADCKNRSRRFDCLFSKAGRALADAAVNVVEEIQKSEFKPYGFEIDISEYVPPVDIGRGYTLSLVGSIDRVDIADGETTYAKIVDYKSGSQVFSLDKIYNGLSMQLPIYAGAVRSGINGVKIAAIYYLRVGVPDIKLGDKNGLSEDEFRAKLSAYYTRDGLFTDSFRDFKIPPSKMTDEKGINALVDYSMSKLTSVGREIVSGNAEISPLCDSKNKISACTYCDYKDICHISAHPERARELEPAPDGFPDYDGKEAMGL